MFFKEQLRTEVRGIVNRMFAKVPSLKVVMIPKPPFSAGIVPYARCSSSRSPRRRASCASGQWETAQDHAPRRRVRRSDRHESGALVSCGRSAHPGASVASSSTFTSQLSCACAKRRGICPSRRVGDARPIMYGCESVPFDGSGSDLETLWRFAWSEC